MNRFRSLPRWLQVVVGTVAAVTVCCCGLVGISLVIPSEDETPTVVVQGIDVGGRAPEVSVLDTETPTPAATDTPVPTATSTSRPTDLPTEPPSATPLPTETPVAEPTVTPQPPTATDTPAPTAPPTAAPTQLPTVAPTQAPTAAPTQPPTVAPTQAPTAAPAAKVVIARVFNSGRVEYVEIVNQGGAAQDLSGWAVYGSKGDERYVFPGGYVLASGARVRLHSGQGGTNAPPGDVYWTDKNVWNNDGETVYLVNAQGNLVHQYRY